MKKVKIYITLLLLFSIKQLSAQQSRSYTTVLKYLDGQTSEIFRMIPTCIDGNGDILIAGISGITDKNITVRKLNPQGALIWEYTFDSDNHGDDWASDMDTDDAGNVYVCGSVVEKNPDKQVGLLIKISPIGSLIWKNESSGSSGSILCNRYYPYSHYTKLSINKQQSRVALALNMSSSIYIDNVLEPTLQQNQDSILTDGILEVIKSNGTYHFSACALTNLGIKTYINQVHVSNNAVYYSSSVWDLLGNKSIHIEAESITSNNRIWYQDYFAIHQASSYKITSKGQYLYVAASMDLSVAGNRDFAVLKIDKNNGALQWIYTLNGSKNTPDDAAKDILVQGNDIYTCGEVNNNVALVKLNPNGIEKMVTAFFGDEKFLDKKSRVSGMVYANGYFWVSGFAYAENKSPNQFVLPFDSQGKLPQKYIYDMGIDANNQISFPIIQSKNIAVDSLGSIWVLGIMKNQNNTYSYPVYRITDFYKEILPVQTDISARADTFAMALASLSQDTQIQSLVTSYMFNSGKETITLPEFEFLYPDLSLKMSESLAKFGLSGTEISNFMTKFRSWQLNSYNLTPYIGIPQVDTTTFDYICWDRITVGGVAKFAGRKDSIPLYSLDTQNSANASTIPLFSQEDFDKFWSKPVWQMGIEFKDMYNNQMVDLYELTDSISGYTIKASCRCENITTPNGNGTCSSYGQCFRGGKGCGKETNNAGANPCTGSASCARIYPLDKDIECK